MKSDTMTSTMTRTLTLLLAIALLALAAGAASASYYNYDYPAAYWGNADHWYDDYDYRPGSTWCAYCDYPYYQRPIVITNYPVRGYGGYGYSGYGYYGWDDRDPILYPGYWERVRGYNRYY